jgi:hypothetical protein
MKGQGLLGLRTGYGLLYTVIMSNAWIGQRGSAFGILRRHDYEVGGESHLITSFSQPLSQVLLMLLCPMCIPLR